MTVATAFEAYAIPPPRLTATEAGSIARRIFGVSGPVVRLDSHQDLNFLVDGRWVLKVANPHFGRHVLELQNAAMARLAAAGLPFAVPEVRPGRDGTEIVEVQREHERLHVRLLTYVSGTPLAARGHLAAVTRTALGGVGGHTTRVLRSLEPPAAERYLQWDVRHASAVVAALARHVRDPSLAALVARAMAVHDAEMQQLRDKLPIQLIHGDVTRYNVLGQADESGRLAITGVIDFGDVSRTYRVAEAAIAAASAADAADDELQAIVDVVAGFHPVAPLAAAEADAVYPLTIARVAIAAVSGSQQAILDPDNAYVADSLRVTSQTLRRLLEIPPALARTACRRTCGHGPDERLRAARAAYGSAVPRVTPVVDLRGRAPTVVDLSAAGESFAPGQWAASDAIERALEPVAGSIALGRYGEARLAPPVTERGEPLDEGAGVSALSMKAPASLHLGIDIFVAADEPVRAPLAAIVERREPEEVTLRCAGSTDGTSFWVRLAGIVPAVAGGARVQQGEIVGAVASARRWRPAHVHVQVGLELIDRLPGRVSCAHAESWRLICPDPAMLVGIGRNLQAPDHDPIQLRAARERRVARAQRLYYQRPPEIVRGWRAHLYDGDGRAYLDMVNNVASIGHSHPRIAAAAERALRRLNTNSRFLYAGMEQLAERLTDLLPAPLSMVFFVNSGSEANDLALRLARGYTRRADVIAIEGAYHGWTTATAAISTTPFDTPHVEVPPGVRIVPAPNSYRGRYRDHDPDPAARYADHVRISSADAAAFICEPQLGNAGGVLPPAGYLAAAYRHIRAAGGVCIADEVQVGYARSGRTFWAFEGQQVIPDIVTIAKPAGNGYPLGVVVTTAEIAEGLRPRTSFFSSTAGSPLSCEIGLAVLDVIRDEGLQAHAEFVGERLRAGFSDLKRRHELIGAVHGTGLYQGIELVRDHATLEPARPEAYAICERMRELGVIVQPTGDHENVLKVKPPLCLTVDDADFFLETLDTVLTDGW